MPCCSVSELVFIMNAGYDNMVAFDDRFQLTANQSEWTGYQKGFAHHHLANGDNRALFTEVAAHAILAVGTLLASLFMTVITYIDLVCKDFLGHTSLQADALLDSWWYLNRIVIIVEGKQYC